MYFYALCGGAGLLFITIVVVCYKCRGKGKITTASGQDLGYPSGNNTNERSLQLEDMDEEDYKNPDDTGRPSLPKQRAAVFDDEKPRNTSYKKVNAASSMSNKEEGTEDPRSD